MLDLGCRGKSSGVETGPGFQEARWKLFFLRTLALYAARIAVEDSLRVPTVLLLDCALTDIAVSGRCAIDSVDVTGEGGDDTGEGEIFRFVIPSLRWPDAEDEEQESLVDTVSPSGCSSLKRIIGSVSGNAVM